MDLRYRRAGGVAIWTVGFGLALVWGSLEGTGAEGVGYGFAPPVEVAALEAGRVLELPVSLHDYVQAGDVVVRLDPQPLNEEREVVAAQLLAVQEEQVSITANEARRFAEGVDGVLIDRARLSSQLSEDLALLETLRERLSLEQDLATTGASSSQAVEEWRRQIRVVEARAGANRTALAVASRSADDAAARNESVPSVNQWQVVAATRALEQVEGRIARLDLKAGIDGQVTWIYRSPGEVVAAGEPVLQVRRTGTQEVVAFLSPDEVVGLEAGDHALVRRSSGATLDATLLSVGSGPQPLPQILWRNPQYPETGVPVRVRVDGEVAPDEPVTLRL